MSSPFTGQTFYFKALTQHPLLSVADERRLIQAVQRGRAASERLTSSKGAAKRAAILTDIQSGLEARNELVRHNTRLVITIAKRYQNLGLSLMDLVQEGAIGLLTAIERFDPAREVRFSTYAYWWVRQAVRRAVSSQGRTIRLPEYQQAQLRRLAGAAEVLRDELGREPYFDELAGALNTAATHVQELWSSAAPPVSLDGSEVENDDDGWTDRIPAAEPPPDEIVAERQLRTSLKRVLDRLPAQQARVLVLRFGLHDNQPRTRPQIAALLKVSPQRIHQIECEALSRLKLNPAVIKAYSDYWPS